MERVISVTAGDSYLGHRLREEPEGAYRWHITCSTTGMTLRPKLVPLALAGAVAVTRLLFRSHYLYDVDSVNFALAMQHFDPRVHQPHPPGYFLYICAGRLLNVLFHDANLALVILSIAASCAAVIVIYELAVEWFDSAAAAFAGVLFLFSPLVWFHGTVALTYIVEAFFSALLGYLCWRIESGREVFIVPAGIVLGISAGVRPSSLLLLAPLFLFVVRKTTATKRAAGLLALLLTIFAWFFPMIAASGGIRPYFESLASLWLMVPSKGTVFNSSPANSIARALTIVFIYCLCFGLASLAPLAAKYSQGPADRRKKLFTLVWILPALCFFTFGYLRFVNSGYLLLLFAPACIWLGLWANEWWQNAAWPKSLKATTIALCAIANTLIFLASPLYCSYRSVRRFEAELNSIQVAIPVVAPASDTVIVGFDSHFLGYRHACYYLPGYLTIAYPVAHLKIGPRIFVMSQRNTQLLAQLPPTSSTRFVLFPLPADGAAYKEYLKDVESHLPARDLNTIHLNGHDFVTGPIADLPLLFSGLDTPHERGVYALRQSAISAVNRRSH